MIFYIYLHLKLTDGTPFYVGKGKGNRYNYKYQRNNLWHNIVNKHGFDVIILEDNLSEEEEAFEREKYWINRIGRRDLGNGPLVNMTDGGEGSCGYKRTTPIWNKGKNLSKEHKEKLKGKRISMSGKNHHSYGKTHSKKSKEKISESHIGKRYDDKLILDLETGIFYTTVKEAANAYNYKYMTLSSWLHDIHPNKSNLIII